MSIRFFLIYLVSFSAFADCPSGESIGSYPLDTPKTFCADYIGSNCLAVCGWSAGSVTACVGSATQQGPYRLTGDACTPSDGGGSVDCSVTPSDPTCWPDPSTPLTPDSPECAYLPVSLYPGCQDTSSGGDSDAVSYYQDSNGTWREIRLTTGLKDTIISSSKSVQDEISKLSQNLGNNISTSNNLLNAVNNNLLSVKDTIFNSINSTNDYLSDIKSSLDNPSSGAVSVDYSGKLDQLIESNGYQTNFLASIMSSSQMGYQATTNVNNGISGLTSSYRTYSEIQTNLLSDIKTILSNSSSSGSGTGSGGGEGSGTGPSVGTAENPAHVASSLYKSCTDCLVDVDGAQAQLDASKEKLQITIKSIQSDFQSLFNFDSGSGSGSSAIASCWDFGSLIGEKCMQLDETWALLKALVLFIFMISIVFMFARGD